MWDQLWDEPYNLYIDGGIADDIIEAIYLFSG